MKRDGDLEHPPPEGDSVLTRGSTDEARQLIGVLCDVPVVQWRNAAFAAARDPEAAEAQRALDVVLAAVDPICLWDLFDDLDTAFHRLTQREPGGAGVSARDREVIRTMSRSAVGALACRERLAGEHLMTLLAPFVELTGSVEGAN